MVLCCVIGFAKKVADRCVDPIVGYIGTEVGHLWNYSANLEKLIEEVDNLNDATKRMEDRIEDAGNRSGETQVDSIAKRWLTSMACLNGEASRIIEEEDTETGSCLMGLRPNLWACYLTSKSAKKVMDDAVELKKAGESIKTVAHVDYSQSLGYAINPDFEELESRKKASEQIVDFLKDPSVKMVGMYGMGGAGKTTLAEEIGVQLYEDGTFRYVVKTNVSNNQKTDLFHIQKQIADLLKIRLENKDDFMARANQLREQLVKKDKLLIILDDVWFGFKLTDVGIPVDRELKILITSRDVNVMNNMNSKHNVPLDILSPDDAWKLFERMADGVAQHSDRYSTALDVVKQCGGIPVLLVTIARALRGRDLETWKEALTQLERFEGDKFVDDGYKRIEVSYKFLPDNELRSLFLLCSQLDYRSILIDDLLRYAMGLGLFQRRKKLEEVVHRLHMHLGDLKGYCLLQDGNIKGTVRMHDVIHKFAAFVAYRDRRMFTVADNQLEEWPLKDELEQVSAISLRYCHFPPYDHQLPVDFDSSKLESFLLDRNEFDAFVNVPEEFFMGMKALRVVDLTRVSLSPVLPSSLNVLVKLRTLCLDNCELDDIAMIGELPMLQVLSLKGSTVSHVPKEIGSLGSSLKLLDLGRCGHLKVIASGVLSNLTLLEDLRIGYSFHKWEPLQGCNNNIDHETSTTKKLASLTEFKNLKNLINLDICISDPKTFPKDLIFEKLERFRVSIVRKGQDWNFHNRYDEISRILKLENLLAEGIQWYDGIKSLISKAENLHLKKLYGFKSLCELDPKGFMKLEGLKLLDMRRLERIIRDDDRLLPVGSFQNLTTINVKSCNVLKYLFSSQYLAIRLLCLKEIRVKKCEMIKTIIVDDKQCQLDEEEGEITHEFAQLGVLTLKCLPSLISFCSNTPNPIQEREKQDPMWSSNDEIVEENQRLPTSLFNKKVVLPKLKELKLSRIEVDEIWDDQFAIEAERTNCRFQTLTILEVKECHGLSYLFTSSMVKSLAQLKKLWVSGCDSIEEIVAIEGEMTEDDVTLSFPTLDTLVLNNLPKFKRFCRANLLECQSLQALRIEKCGALNAFITNNGSSPACLDANSSSTFFHKNVAFPNLKEVTIGDFHQVKMIWGTQLHLNLRSVTVANCRALTSIFPASIALAFKQLKNLSIKHCENLKEIVSKEEKKEDDEEEDGAPTFVFSNLTFLFLSDLPELERFYSGPHCSDWPNLNSIAVLNCDRMIDLLNLNVHRFNASFAKITIPILKDWLLAKTNISVRYQSLSGYLRVIGRIRSLNFPISLLQILQKLEIFEELEKVEIERFSLEQLFPCEPYDLGDDDIHTQALAKTLAGAKHLKLSYLPEMKRIWSEQYADDQFDGIPQSLGILEVEHCGSLMSLAPSTSTTLFQNLTHLTVMGCHGLKKLVASSSTAKSLVNLTKMRVSGCDSLTEIVATDDDHDHDGEEASNNSTGDIIVFGKLKSLKLESLTSLISFCSTTNCNFQFPSLDRVIVVKCPSMEFFSKGTLSTPNLSMVRVNTYLPYEGRWESDLNSTMRQLYKEMNSTDERFEAE